MNNFLWVFLSIRLLNNEGINYLAPAHLVLFDVLWPNVNLVGDWSKLAFFLSKMPEQLKVLSEKV